jgi:hypothetical protein
LGGHISTGEDISVLGRTHHYWGGHMY